MTDNDENILELDVASILEVAVYDAGDYRVGMLVQLAQGGPVRLLLAREKASKLLADLAAAVGNLAGQERLDREATVIDHERQRKASKRTV